MTLLDGDYLRVMTAAELKWVNRVIDELRSGFADLEWRRTSRSGQVILAGTRGVGLIDRMPLSREDNVAEELDDTTAAEVGHALIRWLIDEDPAGVARFASDLESVDDARAARIGHSLDGLLQRIDVA